MDRSVDKEVYYQLVDEITCASRKKTMLTRVLKYSSPEIEYTYGAIGFELLNSGQFQKSIFPLKKATIINPHNYGAQTDLFKAFFKLEKEDYAFFYIKKALSLNPEDAAYHELLITNLKERDRLKDLELFGEEIANMIADPKSIPTFYFEYGRALLSLEIYPQALLILRKVVASNPPMRCDDHYHYGAALYHAGLFEEAIVQFEQVKKLDPNMKLAWTSAAYLNYCLGKVQKAREEFEYIVQNVLEANPTYSNFLLVLLHLDEDKELINRYMERVEQSLVSYKSDLLNMYNIELKLTQNILDRDDIDEKTREFNKKKLEKVNFLLSFINKEREILHEEDHETDPTDPVDNDF